MSLILNSKKSLRWKRNKSSVLNIPFLDISENIQQNKAPFNSKIEKFFEYTSKRNSNIGPGAYYDPKQRSFIKMSFAKKTKSLEEINNNELYNLALFKVVNKKRLLNLSSQKSLIIDKKNKNQVYNLNEENPLNKFNKSTSTDGSKVNFKLIPTTLTKNRVSSIPSKEHYLGYDFDKNGLPIMVDSSSLFIPNKNENENETIDKKINAIDWSKMSKKKTVIASNESTTKENSSNINSNINEDLNDIASSLTNTNASYLKKKLTRNNKSTNFSLTKNEFSTENSSTRNFKSFTKVPTPKKNLTKRFLSPENHLFSKKKKSLEEFVYSYLFSGPPGPGYYQSQSTFDKLYLNKNIYYKHNFGSNSIRNNNLFNSEINNDLGPGYYYNQNSKPKMKSNFFPLNRKESSNNIKKYEKDLEKENLGPGKYNIKSQFDVVNLYYNGPLEKRFFDNNKKSDIGPGEYLQLYDWSKNINIKENRFKKEKKDDKKEIIGRDSYIIKNENPGVGDYNPHIIHTINYDIISKEYKMSNIKTPFNSKQERFLKKKASSNDLLGPGKYFPNNKKIGNINLKNSQSNKNIGLYKAKGSNNDLIKLIYEKTKLELGKLVGPSSYNLQNYNEWHKKSFNSIHY